MSDTETTIDWTAQIVLIRKRFEASLRAGETFGGIDAWLDQVPAAHRDVLRPILEDCLEMVGPESIETLNLASDASLARGSADCNFFSSKETDHVSAVDQCETFRALSDVARADLLDRFQERSFAVNERLLEQGQEAGGLFLIRSGSVDIVDVKTQERIDCDGTGSVLGEMSLLTGQPCSAAVTATSDVRAFVLAADSYHELIAKHPELEIALSQLVSDRLGGRRHDALCGKEVGQYTLERCINRGGMGVVYQAKKTNGGEPVAIKMLRHRFIYDDEMASRFDQEADLLRSLRHPNIVSFRDHFLAYRTRFLVLDLCDGADLFRVLRVHGPFKEPQVRAILGQIAEGLQCAHVAGVIHRDLKPGNVLVDRNGRIRLTDFGLSKLIESDVTDGKAVGTPSYMPFEQFQSEKIGPQVDWYSLGCLACELLTGNLLFKAPSWREMMLLKMRSDPSETWPEIDVSDGLRNVIHGMLQPRVVQRTCDLAKISRWSETLDGLFGE